MPKKPEKIIVLIQKSEGILAKEVDRIGKWAILL